MPDAADTIRLYYYTGKQWGLKSLWEKRLKVALYRDLNDPFELAPFDLADEPSRAFWGRQVERILSGDHGVICFSEDWRTNLMWSHYGEKHTGMCLGFDVDRRLAEPIAYVDQPPPPPRGFERALRAAGEAVLEAALRTKHAGWRHEREWRLRVRLTRSTEGIHYKDFDDALHLREVVLGPRCSLAPADVVTAVSRPPLDVEIFKARAAHGAFEVCRHEVADTHTAKGFRAQLARAPDVFADQLPDEETADAEAAPS